MSVQRPTPPALATTGARAFTDRSVAGRLDAETAQSSHSHLQTGHQRSDYWHLNCFRYS